MIKSMNPIGGYYIIDAGGAVFATDAASQTITGLNAAVRKAIDAGKPILLMNFKYSSSQKFGNAFVTARYSTSSQTVYLYLPLNLVVSITKQDAVTSSNLVPLSAGAKGFESRLTCSFPSPLVA